MKKIILTLALLFIMLIPTVIAEDLVYKQYQEIDLKVPCISNGTYCGSATICNLTVTYPNGH